MRQFVTFAAAIALAAPAFMAPGFASAQGYTYDAPPDAYWQVDPCEAERHSNARTATVVGGLLGAFVGSHVAGRGNRTGGAIIGATGGAVIGHQVGAHSMSCGDYPPGYHPHKHCRWVSADAYNGRNYSYEVCRGRDGYYRPYREGY